MLEEHLEKLRSFHVTAAEGSFLRASEKLHLTQPAVTKSVKLLEEALEVHLFVRLARGVSLTPAGTKLKTFCDRLFLQVRDLEEQLQSDREVAGFARIATHETLAEAFFPHVLKALGKRFPELIVELTTEQIDNHWSRLASGEVDMVVGLEPQEQSRFHSSYLYTDQFQIFCKRGSRFLNTQEQVPISFVRKAFEPLKEDIDTHIAKYPHKFDLRYLVESFTTVRALVAAGACAGVLPETVARSAARAGEIVPIQESSKLTGFASYKVYASCLRSSQWEPKISRLMEILKNVQW